MEKTKSDLDQIRALFERKRYKDAIAFARTVEKESCTEADDGACRQVFELVRASHLLLNVKATEEDVTSNLQSGWYSNRMGQLISKDRLKKLANVPVPMDEPLPDDDESEKMVITGCASFSQSGCAVVMRIGGHEGDDWEVVTEDRYDYYQRNIPADVLKGSYLDQWTDGIIFLKDFIAPFVKCLDDCPAFDGTTCCECKIFPLPMFEFPVWSVEPTGPVTSAEDSNLDVEFGVGLVSAATHDALKGELDTLGERRHNSPAPKYHNIIDPNVGAMNDVWVPTEFQTYESPCVETVAVLERACKKATGGKNLPPDFLAKAIETHSPAFARAEMRSPIPDLDPHDNAKLYIAVQDVMEAALPLLARMRNPALLLPGPLQAVVKAQRIVLKEGETYRGVWHEDGVKEHVVSVVLYYYRVSPTLQGGDIEIASKIRTPVMNLYPCEVEGAVKYLPRSKVPVSEGTLLVFGNYAAVHRVLPMEAVGGPGSRDFLAFFVIDQRVPLPMYRELSPLADRKTRRAELLRRQLEPRGNFALDGSEVYAGGNGEITDIAWLREGGEGASSGYFFDKEKENFFKTAALVTQMNISPPVLGRGISFLFNYNGGRATYKPDSKWEQHILGKEGEQRTVFVDTEEGEYRREPPPIEGVRSVKVFEDVGDWEALGFTPLPVPSSAIGDDSASAKSDENAVSVRTLSDLSFDSFHLSD